MSTIINHDLQMRLLLGEQGPYTVADYMEIPQENGLRYQLMRGWLVREPSPSEIHQRIVGNLYMKLRHWADAGALGKVYVAPFDTVLSGQTVLQPDILFIAAERAAIITRANVQGAPDLAIEVLSGGTARRDRVVKQSLYREAGVTEMWLVDTDKRQAGVFCLPEEDTAGIWYQEKERIVSSLFGQLDFTVNDLFA